MKKCFTLAEVIITIGIIGVVAALTIPTLISNVGTRKFQVQYKKSVYTLNQALRMGIAKYDMDFGALDSMCSSDPRSDTTDPRGTICGLFNSTLSGATFLDGFSSLSPDYNPLRNREDILWVVNEGEPWTGYMLADGSVFFFSQHEGNCSEESPCSAFIDVNGAAGPNKLVNGIPIEDDFDPRMAACRSRRCEYGMVFNLRTCKCEIVPPAYLQPVTVPHDKEHMTDIYPVYFSGQKIVPASYAARVVLQDTK